MTKAEILMIKGIRKVEELPHIHVVIIHVSPWYRWSKARMKLLEATMYSRMSALAFVEYRTWWW